MSNKGLNFDVVRERNQRAANRVACGEDLAAVAAECGMTAHHLRVTCRRAGVASRARTYQKIADLPAIDDQGHQNAYCRNMAQRSEALLRAILRYGVNNDTDLGLGPVIFAARCQQHDIVVPQ